MKTIMIAAATVCGRIGPGVRGSGIDRKHLEEMRRATDASIMGAGTLREGNPEMRGPGGILGDRIRCLVSLSGRIPVQGKDIFRHGPKPLIFTARDKVTLVEETLGDRAEVEGLPVVEAGLDLRRLLDRLAEHGARTVLLEGGGKLNYACLKQGVVDELSLTVIPFVSGYKSGVPLARGDHPLGDPLLGLELISCRTAESGEIFARYKVARS